LRTCSQHVRCALEFLSRKRSRVEGDDRIVKPKRVPHHESALPEKIDFGVSSMRALRTSGWGRMPMWPNVNC
jgi:hypothetical protein